MDVLTEQASRRWRWWWPVLVLIGCLALAAIETEPASAHHRHPGGKPGKHGGKGGKRRHAVGVAPFFGYDVAFGGAGDDPIAKTLKEARQGGANTVRDGVVWSQVQPTRHHHYNFAYSDHVYHQVLDDGMRPLMVITGAPCWAHPSVSCKKDFPSVRPDHRFLGKWRQFVTAVAARYPKARGFEIWNEPNLKGFWGHRPAPGAYVRLLHAAYRGVKRAHSPVPVVFGGLAVVTGWDRYLRLAYEHGAAAYSDVLGVHIYPFGEPVVGWVMSYAMQVDALRRQYDPTAPLWVTETGVSTATGRIWQPTKRRRQQARSLVGIYRGLSRIGVGLVTVYRLRDPRRGLFPARTWQTGLGVESHGGAPKPAYCALARVRGASPHRCSRRRGRH